jgi:hypothetical protein
MPDIKVTDNIGNPADNIKVDLTHPSSLVKYLKTELLHLAVLPDFLAMRDTPIGQAAAAKPLTFEASAQNKFQLGNTKPEIDVTPGAKASIQVNVTLNASLFDADPFHAPAKVSAGEGYMSVGFQGSLDLGVSASAGDLTFGFDASSTVAIGYWKAFPLAPAGPTIGDALGQTLSSFVIPADLADLGLLGENDIATVSGSGSLKISGGVSVTASPNPLACVDLPLGTGSIAVKAGATAGLSAEFTLSGSYQVRARRKDPGTVELSFLKERGTNLKIDLSANAGVKAAIGDTDLIAAVLGAVSTDDPTKDQKLLADLTSQELKTLATAVKSGLNHSLQASLDVVLSAMTDDQAAFHYEIQPALLSPATALAVRKALDGDLTDLTEMEADMNAAGVLTPGLKMLNSVFTEMRKRGCTLKLNLLGILNFVSVTDLIRNSEIVNDDVTGDVTIKETVTGNRISAIVSTLDRHEALRKAIFDSVLVTTSYLAGKAVALPDLSCQQVHFALNQNTNHQIMGDYLRWFVALGLLTAQQEAAYLAGFTDGGPSTCILRTAFADSDCQSMFLDGSGRPWNERHYLEIARQALRALLDPAHQANDALRYRILDDALWPTALEKGATNELGSLVGLDLDDPRVVYLIGDMMDISGWARGMGDAGKLVLEIRKFVGAADPRTLAQNNEFKKKRDALQKAMSDMVKASKMRFDEPWGMVCLYWAGGSPATAYAKTSTRKLLVERGHPPALSAGAGTASQ